MSRFGSRASAALFLFGLLVGGALSGPAASIGETIYTRSVSCAGANFYPADSRAEYETLGSLRSRRVTDPYSLSHGGPIFQCDPKLPNGAVVTKVQFTVRQVEAGIEDCALRRSSLVAASAATVQDLARVTTPYSDGVATVFRVTDTSITNATVDNAKYGYWLECELRLLTQFGIGQGIGIYGADVIYTISATKG